MREVLIVERDPGLRRAIERVVTASGWRGVPCAEPEGLERDRWVRAHAAVIEVGDASDVESLERRAARHPELAVIAVLPQRDLERAVDVVKRGAREVLIKPFADDALEAALATVEPPSPCPLLTADPGVRRLLREAEHAARSDATLTIRGESGTGKDLLARWIHLRSRRAEGSQVVVNCAALPHDLAESELFGHEAGAFSGATQGRLGQLRSADGGTLVLDQVEELAPGAQPKLLRVLQEREVLPVGGERPHPVDLRVIATTQRCLHDEVARGRFRADLLYRLDVISLTLPPLRERPGDIPLLAEHFLERFARAAGRPAPTLEAAGREALLRHAFPGNIRELENLMRRAVVWMPGASIDVPRLLAPRDATPAEPSSSLNLKELERRAVARALEQCDGVRVRAAAVLGISERTLRNKIRLYNLT